MSSRTPFVQQVPSSTSRPNKNDIPGRSETLYSRFCCLLDYTFSGKGMINVHPFGVNFCAWVAQSYLVELLFWWFATQVLMIL